MFTTQGIPFPAPTQGRPRPDFAAERTGASDLGIQQILGAVLDAIDYGIVVVDAQRHLIRANRVAQGLCAAANGVCHLVGTRLRCRHPADDDALHQATQAAALKGRHSLLTLGVAPQAVPVAVVPVEPGPTPAVLLLFGKDQVCEALSVDQFARAHGLTHAEGMVLGALCDGAKPLEIAQRFGVAVSTVRTQISSVRQKTQTASIRDLVRRIAVLPPIVSVLGRTQTH